MAKKVCMDDRLPSDCEFKKEYLETKELAAEKLGDTSVLEGMLETHHKVPIEELEAASYTISPEELMEDMKKANLNVPEEPAKEPADPENAAKAAEVKKTAEELAQEAKDAVKEAKELARIAKDAVKAAKDAEKKAKAAVKAAGGVVKDAENGPETTADDAEMDAFSGEIAINDALPVDEEALEELTTASYMGDFASLAEKAEQLTEDK